MNYSKKNNSKLGKKINFSVKKEKILQKNKIRFTGKSAEDCGSTCPCEAG